VRYFIKLFAQSANDAEGFTWQMKFLCYPCIARVRLYDYRRFSMRFVDALSRVCSQNSRDIL